MVLRDTLPLINKLFTVVPLFLIAVLFSVKITLEQRKQRNKKRGCHGYDIVTIVWFKVFLEIIYVIFVKIILDCKYLERFSCKEIIWINLLRLSDTGIRYLVEGASSSKLRELNLTNCIRVSDVSMLRLAQR